MSQGSRALAPPQTILIVGAGCFGAATALSLCQGKYREHEHLITILDRGAEPPAVDAASSDHNKIIRQDYMDPFYACLAKEAINKWRSAEYADSFHECGVMVASAVTDKKQSQYVEGSLAVNSAADMHAEGKRAYRLETSADIKACYPGVRTADMTGNIAYLNEAGGWADSRKAVVDVLARVRSAGVKFIAGEANALVFDKTGEVVTGVTTKQGSTLSAGVVVLASGAWTSTLLPELAHDLLPTGQVVGTIQLSQQEADVYRNVPVTLLLDTGFYCFPPTHDNVFKFAIHDGGWLNTTDSADLPSVPRTALTPGCERMQLPSSSQEALRKGLARVYPELAHREWLAHRLCWYTDRPSGDWLIDWHPRYRSLFIASGGSGHAFKFFPILGDICVRALEGRLPEEQQCNWSYHGCPDRIDKSRGDSVLIHRVLDPLPAAVPRPKL